MTVDAPPTLPFRLANLNGTRNIQMTVACVDRLQGVSLE